MICTGTGTGVEGWFGIEVGDKSGNGILIGVGGEMGGTTTGTGCTITGVGVGKLVIGAADTFVGVVTGFWMGGRVNSSRSILPSHPPQLSADDSK
jgi:hypothetical protein